MKNVLITGGAGGIGMRAAASPFITIPKKKKPNSLPPASAINTESGRLLFRRM